MCIMSKGQILKDKSRGQPLLLLLSWEDELEQLLILKGSGNESLAHPPWYLTRCCRVLQHKAIHQQGLSACLQSKLVAFLPSAPLLVCLRNLSTTAEGASSDLAPAYEQE